MDVLWPSESSLSTGWASYAPKGESPMDGQGWRDYVHLWEQGPEGLGVSTPVEGWSGLCARHNWFLRRSPGPRLKWMRAGLLYLN